VLDLLNLPGIVPVDLRTGNKCIIVVVNVADGDSPHCPDCNKPMYRHGRRTNVFADTPMQMQPVRLEISRPRYRCTSFGAMVTPELTFLDESAGPPKGWWSGLTDNESNQEHPVLVPPMLPISNQRV